MSLNARSGNTLRQIRIPQIDSNTIPMILEQPRSVANPLLQIDTVMDKVVELYQGPEARPNSQRSNPWIKSYRLFLSDGRNSISAIIQPRDSWQLMDLEIKNDYCLRLKEFELKECDVTSDSLWMSSYIAIYDFLLIPDPSLCTTTRSRTTLPSVQSIVDQIEQSEIDEDFDEQLLYEEVMNENGQMTLTRLEDLCEELEDLEPGVIRGESRADRLTRIRDRRLADQARRLESLHGRTRHQYPTFRRRGQRRHVLMGEEVPVVGTVGSV